MLLFRLYEKVTKKYTRGCALWTPESGSKFRAVDYLLNRKLCLSENFYENLQPCAIPLGVF